MSEYREIEGVAVENKSGSTGTKEGQIWYDTANKLFKLESFVASASWATGTNYPASKRDATGFGTPTAAIIMGGNPANSTANTYNGSSWTSTTAIPANSSGADSDGPQTAGLFVGGTDTTANYDWNGSGWSANPTLPVGRSGHATIGGAAVQTAALAISGEGGTNAGITTSSWNGSTWTAGAAIPDWAQGTSGGGTPAAAFVQGRVSAGYAEKTKNFDGSTWTAGNNANQQHNYGGAGGPATNGVTFGGVQTPNPGTKTNVAETYDGTCWTTSATMIVGVSNAHGKATLNGATSSLCATGNATGPGYSNVTQDFTGAGPVTKTLTTS